MHVQLEGHEQDSALAVMNVPVLTFNEKTINGNQLLATFSNIVQRRKTVFGYLLSVLTVGNVTPGQLKREHVYKTLDFGKPLEQFTRDEVATLYCKTENALDELVKHQLLRKHDVGGSMEWGNYRWTLTAKGKRYAQAIEAATQAKREISVNQEDPEIRELMAAFDRLSASQNTSTEVHIDSRHKPLKTRVS